MDFGMFTDFHVRPGTSQAQAFQESFQQVQEAESMGMDWVWLAEHHFSPERSVLASPLIVASAIAAHTSRIRVGLAVQVLPLTNPLRIAEEAATVDHISKGRFDFGIGRSGLTKYYRGYNVPYSESRGRFAEALDVIMKAWKEDRFSYHGEYFSYEDVTVVPKPYQAPTPPTRIAVASEETFSMAGSLGFPIFVSANAGIPQLQERLKKYRHARSEAGHPGPGDIHLRIPAYVGDTPEKARSRAPGQRPPRPPVRRQRAGRIGSQPGDRRQAASGRPDPIRGDPSKAGHVRCPPGGHSPPPGIP